MLAKGEAPAAASAPVKLRGLRYCEVLAGGRKWLHLEFDVYNSLGLGDCPQAAWERLDAGKLKATARIVQHAPWPVAELRDHATWAASANI